jgi:23S rRNA (uracil-5-)-methyltransferase RumA
MKFGDKTTLRITEMDKKGRGCGLAGQRRACAYFSAPGEEIEASLISRRQGVLIMQTAAVKTPSPHRRQPPCPHAGRCGGCKWQQFDYGFQLTLKKEILIKTLAAAGLDGKIGEVVPCPNEYQFRNRMDYCIGPKGEIGLKEPGRWNAYLDLQTCLLLSPKAVSALDIFRQYMRRNSVAPWDSRRYTGYARYLVIREGKNTDERMIIVVTAPGPLPAREELIKELSGVATTIYHGINPLVTDLSIAPELELLAGRPYLQEKIDDRIFRIPPNSFFQTNTLMAEKLLAAVRRLLERRPSHLLLDLYCGVGFFGISLAGLADKVIGVEIDEPAAAMARTNAEMNGVTNAEFLAAKAESLVWEKGGPDTVIVDPPRAGLHPSVIGALMRIGPERIIYVSCNYESFVRDWQKLGTVYDAADMEAMDLFPHTPHLELVALLEKKKNRP